MLRAMGKDGDGLSCPLGIQGVDEGKTPWLGSQTQEKLFGSRGVLAPYWRDTGPSPLPEMWVWRPESFQVPLSFISSYTSLLMPEQVS